MLYIEEKSPTGKNTNCVYGNLFYGILETRPRHD